MHDYLKIEASGFSSGGWDPTAKDSGTVIATPVLPAHPSEDKLTLSRHLMYLPPSIGASHSMPWEATPPTVAFLMSWEAGRK